MNQVSIQYRNKTGNWTTVLAVENLPPNIAIGMQSVARANPGCSVRAVDASNRLVDMLPS